MRRRLLPIAGPLLGIAILMAACAPQEAAEPVAADHVDLPPSYRFEPEAITVSDGTTVTWTNSDNFTHNVRLLDDGGQELALRAGGERELHVHRPG